MDPQNRILLEQAHLALADARAANLGSLADTRTGVYVGCMYQEFTQLQFKPGPTRSARASRPATASATSWGVSHTPLASLGPASAPTPPVPPR